MCGLLVKCAVLILMIHGFRALGRRVGPRYSGLMLGLPSTTAVMLLLCGCERGDAAATRMAEANLLGLVAAVALPLAYAAGRTAGLPVGARSGRGRSGLCHSRSLPGFAAGSGSRAAALAGDDGDSGRGVPGRPDRRPAGDRADVCGFRVARFFFAR